MSGTDERTELLGAVRMATKSRLQGAMLQMDNAETLTEKKKACYASLNEKDSQ